MEAKDTVMPELYTKSIYMGSDYHPSFKLPLEMKHSLDRVTQAQAEISFPKGKQAGIREVVEFTQPLLDKINDLVSDIRGDWTDPRTECRAIWDIINQWQAQLKEWGLEEE